MTFLISAINPHIAMLVVGIVLLVFALFVLAYFVLCYCLLTKKLFRPKKRERDAHIAYEEREKGFDRAWLDLPYESLTLESAFGYTLKGKLFRAKQPTNRMMLCLHGHNSFGISMYIYAQEFLAKGYDCFIPDHRYSGESGGDFSSFGYFEREDVIAWIDELQQRYPNTRFSVFGASMGSAIAIMVTARDKRIEFLIAYCGYASVEDLLVPLVGSKAIYRFMAPGLALVASTFYKVDLADIRPIDDMATITVPTLILHSKGDKLVPYSNGVALANANKNATFVSFETAGHVRSIVVHREAYLAALHAFLDEQK